MPPVSLVGSWLAVAQMVGAVVVARAVSNLRSVHPWRRTLFAVEGKRKRPSSLDGERGRPQGGVAALGGSRWTTGGGRRGRPATAGGGHAVMVLPLPPRRSVVQGATLGLRR